MPTAPTLTLRQHLQIAANALGVPLQLTVLPGWAAPPLGLFVPFTVTNEQIFAVRDNHVRFIGGAWLGLALLMLAGIRHWHRRIVALGDPRILSDERILNSEFRPGSDAAVYSS